MAGSVTLREIITRWGFDVDDQQLIKLQQREKKLRGQFVKLGAIASAALASVVLPAASLEEKLRRSASAAGKTGKDFDGLLAKLTKDTMDFSEQLGLSASDIAVGFFDVISAGIDPTTKGFDKFAEVGFKLAKVADGSVGKAIEQLGPVMEAFGIKTENAIIVADAFAKANQLGKTSIAQVAEAMIIAGPAGAGFGETLNGTTAALIGFANAGFKGVRGGEAFKQVTAVLEDLTPEAAKEIERLGITIADSSGKFLDFPDILEQFETKLAGATEQQKASSIATIFGKETLVKFIGIMGVGSKAIRGFEKEFKWNNTNYYCFIGYTNTWIHCLCSYSNSCCINSFRSSFFYLGYHNTNTCFISFSGNISCPLGRCDKELGFVWHSD